MTFFTRVPNLNNIHIALCEIRSTVINFDFGSPLLRHVDIHRHLHSVNNNNFLSVFLRYLKTYLLMDENIAHFHSKDNITIWS